MVSTSRSARSSSSFVQYTVLSSEREIPVSLRMQPHGRSQNGQYVAPRKAIDTNVRGIIPSSRSSTQVALLTCSARGENRAHEFLHLLYIQGPWVVRIVVDDAVFKSLRTLVHPEVLKPGARIPPLSAACQENRLGTTSGRGYYSPNVRVDGLPWSDVLSILTSPTGLHLQGYWNFSF